LQRHRQRLAGIDAEATYLFSTEFKISEYDFDRKGFPTGMPGRFYGKLGSDFVAGQLTALKFAKSEKFQLWTVEKADRAREIAEALSRTNRFVVTDIEFLVTKGLPEDQGIFATRVVEVMIKKVTFRTRDGRALGLI
jgi:hypothetical protein